MMIKAFQTLIVAGMLFIAGAGLPAFASETMPHGRRRYWPRRSLPTRQIPDRPWSISASSDPTWMATSTFMSSVKTA